MTSIKLMLNRERILNSGRYPLVFQVIHKRKKKLIYTKTQLFIDEFDIQSQKLVRSAKEGRLSSGEIKKLNTHFKQEFQRLEQAIVHLQHFQTDYTIQDICEKYGMQKKTYKLLHYIELLIKQKRHIDRNGTAAAYQSTSSSLFKFLNGVDINVNEITVLLVREYRDFLLSNGLTENTVAFYMRNFRTIYNRMILDGYRQKSINPFKDVKTTPSKTMKRALTKQTLQELSQLTFSEEEEDLEFSRDLFLFSFYTRGMSFVDIAYLRQANIKNNVIIYRRHKTGQLLTVAITEQMRELIEKYSFVDREFVMPILSSQITHPLYHQYRMALGRILRHLKLIGDRMELEIALTTYVARHSWATIAKEYGLNMSVISEGLGHTSEHTTQIYLKELDSSVLDKANRLVTGL